MEKKYIKNYTSSYIGNADGDLYFLLTFHILWHKAVSGLDKTANKRDIRVMEQRGGGGLVVVSS